MQCVTGLLFSFACQIYSCLKFCRSSLVTKAILTMLFAKNTSCSIWSIVSKIRFHYTNIIKPYYSSFVSLFTHVWLDQSTNKMTYLPSFGSGCSTMQSVGTLDYLLNNFKVIKKLHPRNLLLKFGLN